MSKDHNQPSRPSSRPSSGLLAAIRGNDEQAKQQALQKMYDILNAHAMAKLGRKQHHAEVQASSVVQSVLVREVAAGNLHAINDDQHLEARLKQAVNHKIYDRNKKRRPDPLQLNVDGVQFDPAASGPGVGTQIVQKEELASEAEKLAHFRDACLSASISDKQRAILDLAVFQDKSWEAIATACKTTVTSAKVRMSEARPKVLAHVFQPLRSECDGTTWMIIDVILLQRRSVETASKRTGVDSSRIKQLLTEAIWPAMNEIYGVESWALLKRLLGNQRKARSS